MESDYLTAESADVKRVYADIDQIEETLRITIQKYKPSICEERYLSGEQVCTLLHITSRTLQTLRDTGQIAFTVVSDRTFLYPEKNIKDILENNLHPIHM